MEQYPLVSVIVPVYNGQPFIHRFLRMILEQAYPCIELVLVDDGSEDGCMDAAEVYRSAFVEKGYVLRCLKQTHQGQAAAVNYGLREFTGSYLKWMDCDDLLEPSCIQEEITYLENHPDCGFVICDSRYVNESLETIRIFGRKPEGKDDYFREILKGTHNYSLGSGTILISRENLKTVIPEMQIYESPEGQNYQLILPVTYHYHCGYLRKPLFIRVVRDDSHSRRKRTYQEEKERLKGFIILLKETVRRMEIPEEEVAYAMIEERFGHMLYHLAYDSHDLPEAEYWHDVLKKRNILTQKETMKWIVLKIPFLYRLHMDIKRKRS